MVLGTLLGVFAAFGPTIMMPAYVQTSHDWKQGRLELLVIKTAIPSALCSALVCYFLIRPRFGALGVLKFGAVCVLLGMLALVAVPWAVYALVAALVLGVFGAVAFLPAVPVIIATSFPQRMQAQAQGLLELAILAAIGASAPVYGSVLYDEDAEERSRQAVPFIVSAAA